MLAVAPAPTTLTLSRPVLTIEEPRPATIAVTGRICTPAVLAFTITGVAVSHFLLECDDLHDGRLRRLAHHGTSLIDVTVWGADAVRLSDGPPRGDRRALIAEAAKAGETALWEWPDQRPANAPKRRRTDWSSGEFAPRIRQNVRVVVQGAARSGAWQPVGSAGPLPLGLVAEALPQVLRSATL